MFYFLFLKIENIFLLLNVCFLFLENISDPSFSSIIVQDNFLQMVH